MLKRIFQSSVIVLLVSTSSVVAEESKNPRYNISPEFIDSYRESMCWQMRLPKDCDLTQIERTKRLSRCKSLLKLSEHYRGSNSNNDVAALKAVVATMMAFRCKEFFSKREI